MSPQMNGQGCNILNVSNNLEINTAMYPFPHPYGGRAFFTGRIKNWYSSHQSPHLITNDVNGGCTLFNIPDELTAYKCMGSSVSNNSSTTEGMFTLVNIISDPTITYDVELTCKRVSCSPEIPGSDIEVSFTNGLANSEQQNIPIPDQQIVVGLFNVDNILPEIFPFRDITINGDYSQIWVRTSPIETNSRTEILDVTLTCNTIALTGLLKTKLTSQSYLFEPEATKLFESYDWQIDGNTVSTNETLNFTFEEDGVYKICLDVVDEYGCCAQECDLVAIDSYCDVPADAIIIYDCYDGVFDGVVNLADVITPIAFAPIISNRIFYIAPYTELNVTSWFTQFNGCTFQCDEGSMIRSSSPFFSIVNSTLHGCEKMWKGVYDNDATLDNFKVN